MIFRLLCASVLAFALTGCTEYIRRASYDIRLVDVERPANAQQAFGSQALKTVTIDSQDHGVFEDSLVRVGWVTSADGLAFQLTNKTSQSIRLLWDQAAIVDEYGVSHRVSHNGALNTQAFSVQPPSVIVRKSIFEDVVMPGGKTRIFPTLVTGPDKEQLTSGLEWYRGKPLQVLLPLQAQGEVYEYLFVFRVNDVHLSEPAEWESTSVDSNQ